MSRKARIFIEYGKKKYEISFGNDCTKKCPFVKKTPEGACADLCYLPSWYLNLMKQFDSNYGFPVEVKEKTK